MKSQKQKYTAASLADALRDIRNETMSIRAASREYGVPVTTLHDRIKGRTVDELRKPGSGTVLTKAEESKIVVWLINIARCGFPQKSIELLDVVQKIIKDEKRKTPFKNDRPGKKWYYNFMKRHSELLSVRAPETVIKARAVIEEETIRKWFSDLESHLVEENCRDILDDPTRIFNGDETSFSLAPKSGNVIGPKGYPNIYQVQFANEKDNLTVLLVFSASGETLPPVIVFPYQKVPFKIVSNMPEDWVVGRSDTGWMSTETFYEYIANDFSSWLDQHQIKRPVLLLVDGHKSHISMHISDFCSKNQIILYSLPPNTNHIMQLAEVGAFKGLKSDYQKTVTDWSNLPENQSKTVTVSNFSQLPKLVLDKSDRPSKITNAFKKCGLFPFDLNNIDYMKCIQNNLENEKEMIECEKQLILVRDTQRKLQSSQAPEQIQFEDSPLTSLKTDQLLEEAAIAVTEADRILENAIISDAEILDDFNTRSPSIRTSKHDIVDDEMLEEPMETIRNYDVQNCGIVIRKWRNVKDSWRKNLVKTIRGERGHRKYVYDKELLFLKQGMKMKPRKKRKSPSTTDTITGDELSRHSEFQIKSESLNTEFDENDSNDEELITNEFTNESDYYNKTDTESIIDDKLELNDFGKKSVGSIDNATPGLRDKKAVMHKMPSFSYSQGTISNPAESEISTLINSREQEDRHVSFIKGVLPSLRNFNERQVLKFQMGVLQLIQNIQENT